MMNLNQTLSMLSGESQIDVFLLAEDESLVEMIVNGTEYTELMNYLKDNY
jgi:hypothetical protein